MTDDVDDFLEHFGVMGMQWGVRRDEKNRKKDASRRKDYRDQGYSKAQANRKTLVRRMAIDGARVAGAAFVALTLANQLPNPNSSLNRNGMRLIKGVANHRNSSAARAFTKQVRRTNGKLPVSILTNINGDAIDTTISTVRRAIG